MATSTLFADPIIRDRKTAERLLDVMEKTSKAPYVFTSNPESGEINDPKKLDEFIRGLEEKYGTN